MYTITTNLKRWLYLSGFIFFSISIANGQVNSSGASETNNGSTTDEYAHIFIFYPIAKSGGGYSVFLNSKNICKLANGARIECMLLLEGPLDITVVEGNLYREARTQSRNSRTVSIKKGKSYYFQVNGNGSLEYIFNPDKGQKGFNDNKDFLANLPRFTETPGTMIPALATTNN